MRFSIERVLKQLIILEHKDASQPTTLFISSSGGSIYDALGLCDYMLMTAMPIKVVVIGKAMSAASIITICGTKGLRSAYRNSRFMFHELSG